MGRSGNLSRDSLIIIEPFDDWGSAGHPLAMRAIPQPEPDQIDLAAVLYALSDPTRLELVRQLDRDGERACGTFGVCAAKATLSHHVKVLREAGLIHTRADGVYRFLSLRTRDLNARFPGLLRAVLRAAGEG